MRTFIVKIGEEMKWLMKRLLGAIGYKLQRIDTPMRSLDVGFIHLRKFLNPDLIVDIGVAARGTPELYNAFPSDKFKYLLIDGDPSQADDLKRLSATMRCDALNVCCGEADGMIEFSVEADGSYSSVFGRGKKIKVPVRKLDNLLPACNRALIKIDVEGAEMLVLRGAIDSLKRTEAVVVETSLYGMGRGTRYEGVPSFMEVTAFMQEQGFALFDLFDGANKNGILFKVDAVFVKETAPFRNWELGMRIIQKR